jgi:hypothetical protein
MSPIPVLSATLILTSILTACSDIYRDPCGYVRAPETTVAPRVKNKALGAGPATGTYFPELLPAGPETLPRTRGPKCA